MDKSKTTFTKADHAFIATGQRQPNAGATRIIKRAVEPEPADTLVERLRKLIRAA
jgi:hypothetical protein